MIRRDFVKRVVGVALAVPAVASLAGCGGDDDAPTPDAAPGAADAAPGAADAAPGAADAAPGAADAGGQALCSQNGDVMVTISLNHGHQMVVPAADVAAAVAKVYDLQGTSPHPHTLAVAPADFAQLKAGNSVVITSSNDAGHTHNVTLVCTA